jgi:hypothetical protein
MSNAVGRSHAAHFHRNIPGFRTIVDLRQNVAVDVDHSRFDVLQ